MIDGVLQFELPGGELAHALGRRQGAFVVGPENSLVAPPLDALLGSAPLSEIAVRFNPLVLAGPPGSGKSHAARGLVRKWSERLGDDAVAYFSAADFGRQRQDAEADKALDAWRATLRAKKLVVIDDIDRLRSRTTIQCEACDSFDAILAAGGVIVVTALHEPLTCASLSPSLRDRLVAGLTVRLQRPGLAARRAILAQSAAARGLAVGNEQLDALASHEAGTPAELIGRLARLANSGEPVLQAGSAHAPVDQGGGAVTLKQILAVAARYFGVTQAALVGASRRASLVEARHVVVHLARRLTRLSYAAIGRGLGGRDHTTIMHADRRVVEQMAADPAIQQAVDELERLLR